MKKIVESFKEKFIDRVGQVVITTLISVVIFSFGWFLNIAMTAITIGDRVTAVEYKVSELTEIKEDIQDLKKLSFDQQSSSEEIKDGVEKLDRKLNDLILKLIP